MDDLFDDAAAAELLGASKRWLADLARAGKVPHYQFGRTRRYSMEHLRAIRDMCEEPAFGKQSGRRPAPSVGRGGSPKGGGGGLVAKTPRRLQGGS